VGHEAEGPAARLPVKGDSVGSFRVLVRAAADAQRPDSVAVSFVVSHSDSNESSSYGTYFHGPQK